ncbi:carbohydrate ABC transporter permease [Paenibacillus sp. GCM10027626]|uniref:carbohydrate ABC transporter permease n=1 Tax=Paenibacillus sp. GCM10027626 TaxID=3273411 RepID=UPI00362D6F39
MGNRIFRRTTEDYVIDTFVYFVLAIVFITTLYPFYYSLVISFNNGVDASSGGIYFWPRSFTLDNYAAVFSNEQLLKGFGVTISRTVIGTVLSVTLTALFAYSLAYPQLMFKKIYFTILIIAMYFSGGLIPYFILVNKLHLMNTFLVYIVPSLLGVFNTVIMMSFFRDLPMELKESAKIDGARDFTIFYKIMMPLSTPVLATIALFVGVGHWNNWFDAAYFVTDKDLKTASFWLMDLINRANLTGVQGGESNRGVGMATQTFTAETIRMATMIVIVLPIVLVYPFLQKYFVKGITVGAIKG